MKTLVLSPDDLQNFNKFIYDPKSAAQLAASAGAIGAAAAAAAAVHGPPAGTTVQLLQGSVGGSVNPGVVPVSVPQQPHKSTHSSPSVDTATPAHPQIYIHIHTNIRTKAGSSFLPLDESKTRFSSPWRAEFSFNFITDTLGWRREKSGKHAY